MLRHKFKAKRTEVDDIKFSSKKEAKRYNTLKSLQNGGEIVFFLRQVPFHLPGGVKYVCDFLIFWANGIVTIEDVKGFKNLAGSGFSVGAKAAGKTALKAAGPLGTVLATGFAIKRAAEGDMLGAGLEAASAVLSGTGLGSAASLGIQAYLAKRDSDLIEESIFDEDNFAGGGIVGGLFGLAKGIANLGWLGTKGVLKGL